MKDYTMEFCIGCVCLQGLGYATGVQDLNMKAILAGTVVAIGLSVLSNVDSNISTGLAAIMFLTLAAEVLPETMQKLGLTSSGISDMDSEDSKNGKGGSAAELADPKKRQLENGLDTGDAAKPPASPQFTPEQQETRQA